MTVKEVADIFRVGPDTVLRWIKEGRLPATLPFGSRRIGYRVSAADLVLVLREQNMGHEAQRVEREYLPEYATHAV